ncbi:MAG: hemerythrin family protein [Mariprofundus sp.]
MNLDKNIFLWNSDYETGIASIDSQHQQLVLLINKLSENLSNGSDAFVLNSILHELTDYTIYHFKAEEVVWNEYLCNDEKLTIHQKIHEEFVETIRNAHIDQNNVASEDVNNQVLSFLISWLSEHILGNDQHMAKVVLDMQQSNKGQYLGA